MTIEELRDRLIALGLTELAQKVEEGATREVLRLHCNVTIELFGPEGECRTRRELHNVLCTAGKNLILAAAGTTEYPKQFSYIAIGTGTSAAGAADTALQTESARANSAVSNPSANTLQFQVTFAAGTGTGAITESGLLDAASSGTLLARQTFAAINKGAADSLQISWVIS